jgi:succinoglycan biosynthesis transport protein ExoP
MSQPVEANVSDQFPDADAARGSRGFLSILWQRKALVILGTLLGLLVGALVYWQRPPVYQSIAKVHVIKRSPIMDKQQSVHDDYMATHAVVLSSPKIIERAITKKDLTSLRTLENNGDPIWQIAGSFTVGRDKDAVGGGATNILLLSYRGPVADDCSKIVSAIIESYQEYLDISYSNGTDQSLQQIQKICNILNNDLKTAEETYLKYRQQNSTYLTAHASLNYQTERMLSLQKKRTDRAVFQESLKDRIALLEKADKEGEGKGNKALDALLNGDGPKDPYPTKFQDDQLLPLLLAEKQLLEYYGDDNINVISVRNRIAMLKAHFEKLAPDAGKKDRSPVQRHIEMLSQIEREAKLNVDSLDKLLEEAKSKAANLSSLELEEEKLRKEAARALDVYNKALERLTQLNMNRDATGFDAKVLFQTPGVKVAPSAFQMIAAGLMGGMLVGIGLAFLADLTDKSFRNPDEVRVRLGLPLLGHVPFLQPDPEAVKKVAAGEIGIDPMLLAFFRPKSLESEAYRAVRTGLYFSVQGEGHRILQVSSPNKGDGKSLMVSNLAISMAQSGKKVLVIDADCRRPRQHKIFNLVNTQGLSSVLSEGIDWRGAVNVTPIDGLWIMPSGPIPPNPSELLSSPRFGAMLESARAEFDYVLVDTPPLLAVTDPCVVAGHVDGLVLILRLSRQGRPHAERARQILTSLGVKILGVVVNGVARQSGTGIYSSEHYDYTESYEQTAEGEGNDGYYYHDEDTPEAPAKK